MNLRVRNGAHYYELLKSSTTSGRTTAIINDSEKFVYPQSLFTVDLVTNSWKYGSELQFKSYSLKPPELHPRTDKQHRYYRLECGYLPATHETAESLRSVADQIDQVIGYDMTIQCSSNQSFKRLPRMGRTSDARSLRAACASEGRVMDSAQ